MVGGLLSSAGLVLSSFANSLEYLYISLGILTGTQAPHIPYQKKKPQGQRTEKDQSFT